MASGNSSPPSIWPTRAGVPPASSASAGQDPNVFQRTITVVARHDTLPGWHPDEHDRLVCPPWRGAVEEVDAAEDDPGSSVRGLLTVHAGILP